jgi:hypothetical protein
LVVAATVELSLYAIGVNPVAAAGDRLPRPEMVEVLQRVQAAEGGRIVGLGGLFPANLPSRYGLPDLRAYDPVRPLPYARLLALLGQRDPVLGGPLDSAPAGLCGAWSVRFLLTSAAADPTGWEPVWRGRGGAVWRNPQWLPELRIVGESIEGGWDVLAAETVDFSNAAVVPAGTGEVSARTVSLVTERVSGELMAVRVDCDGPCLVVAARPWAPGWRVRVDGSPAELVRANLAGLGVVVPGGVHEVEFSYHPWRLPLLPSSP